jgi:hypothetical protein
MEIHHRKEETILNNKGTWGWTKGKGKTQHFCKEGENTSICGVETTGGSSGFELPYCKRCEKELGLVKPGAIKGTAKIRDPFKNPAEEARPVEIKAKDLAKVTGKAINQQKKFLKDLETTVEKEKPKKTIAKKIKTRFNDTVGLVHKRESVGGFPPLHNHQYFREVDDDEYASLKRQVRFLHEGPRGEARGIVTKIETLEKLGWKSAPKRLRFHLAMVINNLGMRKSGYGGQESTKPMSTGQLMKAKKAMQK